MTSKMTLLLPQVGAFEATLYVTLAAVVSIPCYAYYRTMIYPTYFSPLRHLPGPRYDLTSDPILGTFGDFVKEGALCLNSDWITRHGRRVRLVGPLGLDRLIFTRPEALHTILNTDWLIFPKPKFVIELMGLIAGYGLLTATGKKHRRMRKYMNPAFAPSQLSSQTFMYHEPIETSLVDIFCKLTDDELKKTGENSLVVPAYEWCRKVTLDVICSTAFGYNSDCLRNPHNELAEAYEEMVVLQDRKISATRERLNMTTDLTGDFATVDNLYLFGIILSLPLIPRLINTEWAWRNRDIIAKIPGFKATSVMISSMHKIKAIARTILKERIAEAEAISAEDTTGKKDIMSILVRARVEKLKKQEAESDSEENYTMGEDEMMDQILNFLGAGHETTAGGITWTLWLLANNQDWQQRLREELMPWYEPDENGIRRGRLEYRQYQDFPCLERVVNESLRLYPPVPYVSRRATETTVVDGVAVPAGTYINVPIQVLNTLKEVWGEDASKFNPSRWDNLPKTYDNTYSMLSFLTGPHSCIGKMMATVEIKAVLAALLVNFQFEPSYEGQTAHVAAMISLRPEDSMPLRIRRL